MLIFLKKNSRFCAARAGLWKFLCGAKFRHCECTENEQRQRQKTPWILDILAHMNIRPDTYMGFLFCKLTFSSFEFSIFWIQMFFNEVDIYIYIRHRQALCFVSHLTSPLDHKYRSRPIKKKTLLGHWLLGSEFGVLEDQTQLFKNQSWSLRRV